MNNTWFIYVLTDPRDGRIRYVGKTDNLKRRLRMHLHAAMNAKSRNRRVNWIRSLMLSGLTPCMPVLESGDGDWKEAERRWIRNLKKAGLDLVNSTDGGEDNGADHLSDESRRKIGAAWRGRKRSEEQRAKISAARKAMSPEEKAKWVARLNTPEAKAKSAASRRRPEVIAKLRAAHIGRKMSAEARANMSASHQNITAETRAKMSAAHKGIPLTSEHRARIGASLMGQIKSDEARAKTSAWLKGRPKSAEHRANMSAVRRGVLPAGCMTPEARAKAAASHTGMKRSAEARAHMASAQQAWQARRRAARCSL